MVSTLSQGMTNRRRLLSKSPESIQVYWCLERGENRSALSRDDKSSQGTAKVAHIHSSLSVPRERNGRHALSEGDSISTGYCQGRPCLSRSNRPPREKDGRHALSKDTPFLLSYCRSRPGLPQPICPRRKDEFVNWVAHLTCALPKMSSARMIGAKPR